MSAPHELEEGPATGAVKRRILIIEDDPDCRIELRLLLEEVGYRVLHASDARAGLRLAEEHGPELIVQDLLLPDVHGFDLVKQLRRLPGGKTLPIIALSAFPERLSEARATALGFNSFIRKPPPVNELCALIEKLLAA